MNKKYWNDFYKKYNAPTSPTNFAYTIQSMLKPNKKILELGCGNGRDSIFFYHNKLKVTAIDQAKNSINILKKNYPDIEFIVDNFIYTNYLNDYKFDYIYSRFTLHSINKEEEKTLLKRTYNALNTNGKIFIEARSTKDEIYGLGKQIGKHEYIYENHYRRFIDINEIKDLMEQIGYKIELCIEDKGFAPYKNQDPIIICIIASK